MQESLFNGFAKAISILVDEVPMPEFGRHGHQRDHVACTRECQAIFIQLLVFQDVEQEIEAALVTERVHQVKELLA